MRRTLLPLIAFALLVAPASGQTADPEADGHAVAGVDAHGPEVAGHVVDAETEEPVAGATVRIDGTTRGTSADGEGRFRLALQPGDHWVLVSAVGYAPARIQAHDVSHLTVRLEPAATAFATVTVEGDRPVAGAPSAPARTPATTEDLLARLPGVSLVHRANFAAEPIVRGYQGGQISLTIDGMPVYGACVDKMDPASSYVEPENLAAVEVSKGAGDLGRGPQIGGAVDLVTERPRFGVPLAAEGEVGVESNGLARRVRGAANWSSGRLAVRASGSYRGAGNYAPGGGEVIETSGYEKRNLAAAAALRLGEGHTLTAQVLADDAWLVGYPALLMDAVLAEARLGSLAYEGRAPGLARLDARLYRNRVDHYMDDRSRNVLAREVMRGMFMPMGGYTDVVGARTEAETDLGGTTVALTADVHRLLQFGDMTMFSVFPGIRDMVLLNVGDVEALNAGVSLQARRALSGRVALSGSVRLDGTARDVGREEMRQLFARRTGSNDVARRRLVPSASATLTVAAAPQTQLRLTVADAGRLPTVVEQYGHYVYNYVDGFFYTGDPDLLPERSRQIEVGLAHAGSRFAIEAGAYVHALSNVVVGLADRDVVAGLAGSTYRFRLYDNAGRGWMAGGEASALARLGGGLEAVAGVSAAFGHNLSFDEPLPMIPPVGGTVALRYDRGAWFGEVESRWALGQDRVARFTFAERPTDGFAVFAVRGSWRPAGLASGLRVQAGVENVFDTFYQEHLAISDLAARGRSAYVALGFDL
ncbi:MAG: TonB-dependent receptor [Bacteroidota bacterium]